MKATKITILLQSLYGAPNQKVETQQKILMAIQFLKLQVNLEPGKLKRPEVLATHLLKMGSYRKISLIQPINFTLTVITPL